LVGAANFEPLVLPYAIYQAIPHQPVATAKVVFSGR
jgi:hypothetical protein